MLLTNNDSIQEVLFFPQMRPEKFEESKSIELKENEQVIHDIIAAQKTMNLVELKEASGLSNKQWDKGIKALGKYGLTKVSKTDTELLVEFTG